MHDHPYAAVERDLVQTAFGSIRYVVQTPSTNDDAALLLGDANAAGLTIVAEYQTRGAGRKGRMWSSRPGEGLLFTTILPAELSASDIWIVPFWAALAIRSALAQHGIDAAVHWPNDLLAGGKKLCGILCTSRIVGARAWVGCGVGINVLRAPGADASILPTPAFCSDFAPVDRAGLLQSILLAFDAAFARLQRPRDVARDWETAAGLPGARYRILKDGAADAFDATAIALADGGALIVERNGEREAIALADARALR
jgi:BirA family biotin operon repressor/biotin-[acetyl-CoA-carboxylase] ligase